jgi:hypothetical protein
VVSEGGYDGMACGFLEDTHEIGCCSLAGDVMGWRFVS